MKLLIATIILFSITATAKHSRKPSSITLRFQSKDCRSVEEMNTLKNSLNAFKVSDCTTLEQQINNKSYTFLIVRSVQQPPDKDKAIDASCSVADKIYAYTEKGYRYIKTAEIKEKVSCEFIPEKLSSKESPIKLIKKAEKTYLVLDWENDSHYTHYVFDSSKKRLFRYLGAISKTELYLDLGRELNF